jgi:hypothetical protein
MDMNNNDSSIEMLTYHRRGQWFKSSTAHHSNQSDQAKGSSPEELLPLEVLVLQLAGPEGRRVLSL